jgi:ubiquinone biosynthesis monooxygenase Coq7
VTIAPSLRSARYLKLDHLGERIAVSIYAAQRLMCRWSAPQLRPLLDEFLSHERRHVHLFAGELRSRRLTPCRGAALLRLGGWLLGTTTALFGTVGIMACTAAVETVVLEHLRRQLTDLREMGDTAAVLTIESILADELAHRTVGVRGSRHGVVYRVLHTVAASATTSVISAGLYL